MCGGVMQATSIMIFNRIYQARAEPYTLHPIPYTPHPTSYTPLPTPYTLHPTPYFLLPARFTLHPAPYTLHPTPLYPLLPAPTQLQPLPLNVVPVRPGVVRDLHRTKSVLTPRIFDRICQVHTTRRDSFLLHQERDETHPFVPSPGRACNVFMTFNRVYPTRLANENVLTPRCTDTVIVMG